MYQRTPKKTSCLASLLVLRLVWSVSVLGCSGSRRDGLAALSTLSSAMSETPASGLGQGHGSGVCHVLKPHPAEQRAEFSRETFKSSSAAQISRKLALDYYRERSVWVFRKGSHFSMTSGNLVSYLNQLSDSFFFRVK